MILKKFVILKKGNRKRIGNQSEKICKQVRDQIVWKQVEDTTQEVLTCGVLLMDYIYATYKYMILECIVPQIARELLKVSFL